MIQLKSMPEKLKAINFWFYRVVLILILIFIANLGGIIAWTDSLRNPPLREPNEGDLEINPQEDISYLKETLTQIFPEGIDNLTAEEKSIDVLRFVVIDLKNTNNLGTATKILQDGYAVCGGESFVFQTLLRLMGIPSRTVELFNTSDSGHDLVEVYYDHDWHVFDASYGIFAYSRSAYDKEGEILSMLELQKNPDAGYLQGVTDRIWTGQYSPENRLYGVKSLTT